MDLAPDLHPTVYLSDASKKGDAVLMADLGTDMVSDLVSVRERWRFKPVQGLPYEARRPGALEKPGDVHRPGRQLANHAAEDGPFDAWAHSAADPDLQDRLAADRDRGDRPRALRDAAAFDPHLPSGASDSEADDQRREEAACSGTGDASTFFGEASVPAVPEVFEDRSAWTRLVVGAWRAPDFIHNLECSTSLIGLYDGCQAVDRRRELDAGEFGDHGAGVTLWDTVVLSVGDNMADLLSTDNGRATNRNLNCLCRRSAGAQGQHRVRWRRRFVGSQRNASDGDSRLADDGVLQPCQCFHYESVAPLLRHRAVRDVPRGPVARLLGPAVLEAFCGKAAISRACADQGMRVATPLDTQNGSGFDISNRSTLRAVAAWLRSGLVWLLWLAVPCTLNGQATA